MSEPTAIVAPWRPRVLAPGMPSLDLGVERYVVRGGGLLGVEIMPGDRIELATLEGGQAAELSCSPTTAGMCRHPWAWAALSSLRASAPCWCRRRGCSPHSRRPAAPRPRPRHGQGDPIVCAESPAGAEVAFTVGAAGYLLVAAPGAPMSPWDHDPPTDLLLFVRRALPSLLADERLPEPLADPRLDLRGRGRHRRALPRARRRVHPDHRRARAAAPTSSPTSRHPGPWRAARDRQRHHAHAHRQRLSQARSVLQVLRRGDEPAGRGRAGHGRPPRQLQPRLHRPLL